MLRISIIDTNKAQKFVLQGKLTEPWVSELRVVWENSRIDLQGRSRIVDLNDAQIIDQSGMDALQMMHDEGAQFLANGVLTKYFLECLADKRCVQFGIKGEK